MTKEEIKNLINEKGGPISAIEFLISNISDDNINKTSEYIKYILSIRYVSKKTYIGEVNFYDYLINNGINIK